MKDYDERAWELEVMRCDDGDLLLSQGYCPCGCGDEVLIRLNPAHFALVAAHMELVPASEVARSTERERDRLNLLAAMVMAHTRDGDPLRAAACLLKDAAVPKAGPLYGGSRPEGETGSEIGTTSPPPTAAPARTRADETQLDLLEARPTLTNSPAE